MTKKRKPSAEEIVAAWEAIVADDPDTSTEQLFARVCDRFDHRIDNGDICEALNPYDEASDE